jgi:hypothetical protein
LKILKILKIEDAPEVISLLDGPRYMKSLPWLVFEPSIVAKIWFRYPGRSNFSKKLQNQGIPENSLFRVPTPEKLESLKIHSSRSEKVECGQSLIFKIF